MKSDKRGCGCSKPAYPIKDGSRCKLFWCVGCKKYIPWCQGVDLEPDPRCNTCVMATTKKEATS